MNIVLKTGIIFTGYLLLCINHTTAQKQQQNYYTPTQSDTWVATDALGRTIGENIINPRRTYKTVGLFYFIWQGAHGYDHHSGSLPDEGVMTATAADSISPYARCYGRILKIRHTVLYMLSIIGDNRTSDITCRMMNG